MGHGTFLNDTFQLSLIQGIARKRKTKIYLVGGFLRDALLGLVCFDFDFAVSKDAIKVARLFSKKIKGAFVLLDAEHGCARVVIRQNFQSSLARSRRYGECRDGGKKQRGRILTFDFADFRDRTISGDLAHRDFTINTFCVDVQRLNRFERLEEIFIDGNKGLKDLKAKTIRMVSTKSFKEDPLRLVRAFSLRAALDFKIEKKTLARIKKDAPLLKGVAFERVRDELFKVLETPRAAKTLALMDQAGLLQKVMPQITVMYRVKQGGYHHLDVWRHSLQAVCELEQVFEEFKAHQDISEYLNESLTAERKRLSLLKLATLLHDIGKPATLKKENGKMSFHGHEHVGKNIVRHVAIQLKFSTKERYILEDLVRWHLRPGYLSNFKSPSQRAIFRFFRDTKDEAVGILLLSLADQRATRGPFTSQKDQKHHEAIIRKLIALYYDKKKEKPFVRLINGNDLIKKLKLKPSPLFTKILREVEEKQALGRIATKDEALKLARTIAVKVS